VLQAVPVQRFGPRGDFNLVQCQDCGLRYLNPRPSPEEMNGYYPSAYREFRASIDESLRRSYQEEKLHKLQAHSQGGRLLDVGCADGLFLHLARLAGYEVQGVEMAEGSTAHAQEMYELDVFTGGLREASFPDEYFDVVTFWHVLEHLHEPLGDMRETHRILRPDGLLIVEVPNIASWQARLCSNDWIALDVPRHLYHFSADTLRAMLAQAGFACIEIGYWARGHNMGGWDETIKNLTFRLIPKSAGELRAARPFGQGLFRYLRYALFLPLHWSAFAVEQVAVLRGQGGVLCALARKREGTKTS
jgi:2-polyprenyl-3-methyl-5-hydroxy-6-metoxy-1,4-benzoquinol methylase